MLSDLEDRLERVESLLAIQQLPIRYAIAVDSRDLDLMAEQWVPDAWMGKRFGEGRDAVKAFFEPVLQGFYRTIHMIVGQKVDLVKPDQATGSVYCRAEHESGRDWIVQAIIYEDTYRRHPETGWGFAKRVHHHWYSTPVETPPSGPTFENWPDREGALPDLPHIWPSWNRYWSEAGADAVARKTEYPDRPS
jgi:hypothetical protein